MPIVLEPAVNAEEVADDTRETVRNIRACSPTNRAVRFLLEIGGKRCSNLRNRRMATR